VKTAVALVTIVLMIAVPIVALIVLGKRLARRVVAKNPGSEFARPLTKTGIALNVCLVLLLLGGWSASQVAPESPLASFLRSPRGAVAGFVMLAVGFGAAALAFRKAGYPMRRP